MNILYIGSFEFPDKNAATIRCRNNAVLFEQLGFKLTFIGISKERIFDGIEKSNEIIEEGKTLVRSFPKSIKKQMKYMFFASDIINFIEHSVEKYSIVICYNFPSISFIHLRQYCIKNNIRIINECTEWYSSKGYGLIGGVVRYLDVTLRIHFIPKIASYNIVTTDFLGKYCGLRHIVVPETYVEQKKRKPKTSTDALMLIYMGNPGFTINKDNLGKMIDLLWSNRDKEFIFNIVGVEEADFRSFYKDKCNQLDQISEKVVFWGRKTHQECIDLIETSDYVFLYRDISRISTAGFPHKLAESVEYSVPFITTDTSDIIKYFKDGVDCWILSFNDDTAGKQLGKILEYGFEKAVVLSDNLSKNSPLCIFSFEKDFRNMLTKINID